MNYIAQNLAEIHNNIAHAAAKSGRKARDVTLVAVTKTVPVHKIEEAVALGLNDFGENRVQELENKIDALPPTARWHLIGHLQTNKVKNIIDKIWLLHSLDRYNLAETLAKQASIRNLVIRCLIQVNVAEEDTKFGLAVEEVIDFCEAVKDLSSITICGLMTIAPFTANPEEVRPVFRGLRGLAETIRAKQIPDISMDYLSMGMSNDYLVAIEEGSNLVRIGTSIFGERI